PATERASMLALARGIWASGDAGANGGQAERTAAARLVALRLFDHFAAHVMPAIRANCVRGDRCAASLAEGQLARLQVVVRPPFAGPRIRLFALGDSHATTTCDILCGGLPRLEKLPAIKPARIEVHRRSVNAPCHLEEPGRA